LAVPAGRHSRAPRLIQRHRQCSACRPRIWRAAVIFAERMPRRPHREFCSNRA
jgi:hypothetical protein